MNSKNSAWTIGCSQHGYSFDKNYFNSDTERVPTKTGPNNKTSPQCLRFWKAESSRRISKPMAKQFRMCKLIDLIVNLSKIILISYHIIKLKISSVREVTVT
jgi:hypothetical protein